MEKKEDRREGGVREGEREVGEKRREGGREGGEINKLPQGENLLPTKKKN